MFLLDTSVLSVMISAEPAQEVVAWIVTQSSEDLFTAAVWQAEILTGIALLPKNRRRADLEEAAHAMFADDFHGRVLPFDIHAATAYAEVFAFCRRVGRFTRTVDLMVAAIARARKASLVTCNVADFEGIDLKITKPWGG